MRAGAPIVLRRFRAEDAPNFLRVHRAAVRALAKAYYPEAIIKAWAPLPISKNTVEKIAANAEGEFRVVAETQGRVVGIGVLGAALAELRACYVSPDLARQGVGRAILKAIENEARAAGVTRLWLDASLNAERFYAACGYVAFSEGLHRLGCGEFMACIRMEKALSGG